MSRNAPCKVKKTWNDSSTKNAITNVHNKCVISNWSTLGVTFTKV